METIINVDDVSFSYGTQTEQALSHISLSVNKGDFIGIIGPSGAGKSTFAACLSGAVPHHYTGTFFGSVMVDGHDTCEVSLTDVSQIVGSVLQDIDTQMVASVVVSMETIIKMARRPSRRSATSAQREQGRFHRHHSGAGPDRPTTTPAHSLGPSWLTATNADRRVANRRQRAAGYRHADARFGR